VKPDEIDEASWWDGYNAARQQLRVILLARSGKPELQAAAINAWLRNKPSEELVLPGEGI
jgi:hypothetical protein